MGSSELEHAIKVRKPYTITKQREKWTEEEHNKFVEALKLYGRSWRRIEEHIGTKTAVQIRSHAQKFFSKVVRESASDSPGTAKTIEIPPPRPKRKPIHPYPRKLGHPSSKGIPAMEQLEWSSSVSEQENKSPTSVLSAFGSGAFGSSVSNLPNSYASPSSSADGPGPVGTLMSEQENESQSTSTSAGKEDRSPSPCPTSAELTSQDKSAMELDLGVDDHIPTKEVSSTESHATSLKLFGRTVLVAGSQKPFSSSTGSVGQCHESLPADMESHQGSIDLGLQIPAQPLLQNTTHEDPSAVEGRSQWNPWLGGMPPTFYCLPSHGNCMDPAQASIVPLPWWALFGGLPFPVISPQSMSSEQDSLSSYGEGSNDREMQKEGSLMGSNTASASEVEIRDKSSEVTESQSAEHSNNKEAAPAFRLRPSERSAFSRPKARSNKSTRGFTPYRRCVAGKEAELSELANDNGDGQGIRLCL